MQDEQPMRHEIGKRTYIVAPVEPLDVDGVRTVQVGSALWLLGFVALLPFYGRLVETGRVWWLWTCMAGLSLGLFGYEYARRRRRARGQRPAHGQDTDGPDVHGPDVHGPGGTPQAG